jgi:serine/threonine protein kinase
VLVVLGPSRRASALTLAPAAIARVWAGIASSDGDEKRTKIGRFELLRELGRGGMGVVYEARDTASGRTCALKLIVEARAEDGVLVERFRREAVLGGRLAGVEGIVSIEDAGAVPETGELWGVMALVEGASLRTRIDDGLAFGDGAKILAKVARAVARAHERGVVHRDLKPENVLVSAAGEPFVTDFGLAKALDDAAGLTKTGSAMGTLAYVAPEQLLDAKRAGPAADVYGLGAILYAVLAKRPPYEAASARELYELVVRGELVPPSELGAKTPRALDELCRRALSREPEARPTAAGFAAALEEWLAVHFAETRLDAKP